MTVSFYKESLQSRLLDADDLVLAAMQLVSDNDPVFDALRQARRDITNELNQIHFKNPKA